MKKVILRSVVALVSLLLVAFLYVQYTLMAAEGGLPAWDGDLELSGVEAPISIARDEHGNPHISASSEADLFFAQGFVHAQDRFWQMALARQLTQGRLSEWFGSRTLNSDRFQRAHRWQEVADASYAAMAEDDRRLLDAYAAGINAWLTSDHYRRPPEMRILHVHPEPWHPSHSYLMGGALFLRQAQPGSETLSGELHATGVSPELFQVFNGKPSSRAHPIIEPTVGEAAPQRPTPVKERTFSNGWTVSGEHTASGLPLMANDPHLGIALPNAWHLQAHHLGDGLRAGATFPGIPGIAIGHNSRLAWGITNGNIDSIDVVLLEKHPEDGSLYRRGPQSEWEAFTERTEVIRVRFGRDVTETVRRTEKGLVWPEDFPARLIGDRTDRMVEARTVIHDHPGDSVAAYFALNRASTVEAGMEALRDFTSLHFNFSFADVAGDIGYALSGRIAIRDEPPATVVGFYPEDDNEWAYIDFDDNPRVTNPASGRIVSANQQIVDDTYPHYLSDRWAGELRAEWIHEQLDASEKHSVATFRAMHADTRSPAACRYLPLLLGVEPAEPADAALVAILEDWDCDFSLDTNAAVIWATWVAELRRQMLSGRLRPLRPPGYQIFYFPLASALGGENAEWCDNPGTDAIEDCASLLASSLGAARRALEQSFGADPAQWRWGDVSRFRQRHAGFEALPVLGDRFNRISPMKGGPESLFQNRLSPDEAPVFRNSYGASSFQGIYDLASLEDSLFMISGGASGHFKSPHYNDMTDRWLRDERIKLGEIPAKPTHVLRLNPAAPQR